MRSAPILALALLTACAGRVLPFGAETDLQTARVPAPVGFAFTTQHTLESAQHWQEAARRVARVMTEAYRRTSPDGSIPVFLAPMGTTPFAQNFRQFLLGELAGQGIPQASAPDGAMVLEVSTQTIQHQWNSEKSRVRTVPEPGFVQGKDDRGRYLDVPVVREDRAEYTGHAPATEMVLSAGLYLGSNVLAHTSTVFYIPPEERRLYQPGPAIPQSPLKHYLLVE
ncbi:hypothetical protein TDMWS_19740 [Thermodesulfomicrobium sp. WS]|jgi:hypothetical protein|uniref:hypothetical protein n=1 Tax=Thermodesulfomicrobium sp. WS TaxID=3004129 RepID=UPI00249277BB|nr:hypothetical protein [Thermodesulfomicrobium sp. WS]BDV01889.1 hypothetical protein TDMWS_19740 [Thermodesulfomicrobium sp. WS]